MDFHTHIIDTPPGTGIVCLPREVLLCPDDFRPAEGGLYAVGIHPWWVGRADFDGERLVAGMRRLLTLPEVVHIGECGLDSCQGDGPDRAPAPLERQEEVFAAMVALSESHHRPLTIHCVRCFDRLLHLKKSLRPREQWTIHGFRGGPALARQLLDAGFDLSFGPRHNAESYALTPPDRRHDESDAEA